MNIYILIDDYGVEAYTRNGLILHANKVKFNNVGKVNFTCIKTTAEAVKYLTSMGASVHHTELIRG